MRKLLIPFIQLISDSSGKISSRRIGGAGIGTAGAMIITKGLAMIESCDASNKALIVLVCGVLLTLGAAYMLKSNQST